MARMQGLKKYTKGSIRTYCVSIFILRDKHLIEIWEQERTGRVLARNTVLFCPYVTQASCYNDADEN